MKKNFSNVLFALTFLTSFSTYPVHAQSRESERQNAEIKTLALKKLTERILLQCQDPKNALYYSQTACKGTQITSLQMQNQTKITPEEKAVFAEVRQSIDSTLDERISIFKEYGSDRDVRASDYIKATIKPALNKNDQNLYTGKITWGDYNKERYTISEDLISKMKQIYQD